MLGTWTLADAKEKISADLVAYGKIFTSEKIKLLKRLQSKTANIFMLAISKAQKNLWSKAKLKLLTTATRGL